MDDSLNLWLIGGGVIVGLLFGAIVQRSRFCLVAAVSNLVLVKDHRHLHAYTATQPPCSRTAVPTMATARAAV